MSNPDTELIDLYQEHRASEMDDKELLVELTFALEGEEVNQERALALTYEVRDRYMDDGGDQ